MTTFEYRLHPVADIYGGPIAYPVDRAEDLVKFHREYIALRRASALLWTPCSTSLAWPRVTLVVHDWVSALGFDWANRHREAVVAIA